MGMSYTALLSCLHRLYRSLGVMTQAQAVAVLDERYPGWRDMVQRAIGPMPHSRGVTSEDLAAAAALQEAIGG